MTDNTQELDEILYRLVNETVQSENIRSLEDATGSHSNSQNRQLWSIQDAKQSILDWNNKQTTKELDAIMEWHEKEMEEVLDRLESQQGKIDLGSYSDMQRAILPEAIEAERNKLKEED